MKILSRLILWTIAILFFLLQGNVFSEEDFSQKEGLLEEVCKSASPLDFNGDGIDEIHFLKRVPGDLRDSFEGPGTEKKRGTLLLLVEERLFQDPKSGSSARSIVPALAIYAENLRREGWDVFTLRAEIYSGKNHQDGRILLALRKVFQQLYQKLGNLRGVILVGNFPDAYLVRQYLWKKHGTITIPVKKKESLTFQNVHYWRDHPEPVADRSDIVLGDLDGNWDRVYVQEKKLIPSFTAVFPQGTGDAAEGKTKHYHPGHATFEDFFYVNDGKWEVKQLKDGECQIVPSPQGNEECSPADLKEKNPAARPEIFIGRLNTYHIAVVPDPSIKGIHGETLLSPEGKPQTVAFKSPKEVPHPGNLWIHSEELERKLLNEYFLLNHRYRMGDFTSDRKPANISTHWHSSCGQMAKYIPDLQKSSSKEYDLVGAHLTLVDCLLWLKRPALLRALKAHSDPWGCVFGKVEDENKLKEAVGGHIWGWHRKENKLIPGYGRAWGKFDFPLFRALYENKALPDSPSMYLHTGCSSISPSGAARMPYSHSHYGHWQHAESLVYYCKGLVLIGRAKVFNDEPRDFFEELGKGKTWGEAWMHYFEKDSQSTSLNTDKQGIRRKKAYFWSLVGDPTLRVKY